jgi:hypothetical protein
MNVKLKVELPRGRLRWEQQGRKDVTQKDRRICKESKEEEAVFKSFV